MAYYPRRQERPSRREHRAHENANPTLPQAGRGKLDFSKKLFNTVEGELLYSLETREHDRIKVEAINLATLQRTRLHVLQYQLANYVETVYDAKSVGTDIYEPCDGLLHAYCDALRDLDYMRRRGGSDKTKDPFIITSSRDLDRTLLCDVGLINSDIPKAQDHRHPKLSQAGRTEMDAEEQLKSFVYRVSGALLGMVALFAPVLIMILVPSLATSLATTFAFVVLVAAGLAWFTGLPPDGVLSLSFTYAAVLVVFIGTSMAPAS